MATGESSACCGVNLAFAGLGVGLGVRVCFFPSVMLCLFKGKAELIGKPWPTVPGKSRIPERSSRSQPTLFLVEAKSLWSQW
jgi:hypothetical protein